MCIGGKIARNRALFLFEENMAAGPGHEMSGGAAGGGPGQNDVFMTEQEYDRALEEKAKKWQHLTSRKYSEKKK